MVRWCVQALRIGSWQSSAAVHRCHRAQLRPQMSSCAVTSLDDSRPCKQTACWWSSVLGYLWSWRGNCALLCILTMRTEWRTRSSELVGIQFYACIWEVSRSNLGQRTDTILSFCAMRSAYWNCCNYIGKALKRLFIAWSLYLYNKYIRPRRYDTSRKVAGSRPDEVNAFFFNWSNPSIRTRPLGLLSL
jgi:hypothetical protein